MLNLYDLNNYVMDECNKNSIELETIINKSTDGDVLYFGLKKGRRKIVISFSLKEIALTLDIYGYFDVMDSKIRELNNIVEGDYVC